MSSRCLFTSHPPLSFLYFSPSFLPFFLSFIPAAKWPLMSSWGIRRSAVSIPTWRRNDICIWHLHMTFTYTFTGLFMRLAANAFLLYTKDVSSRCKCRPTFLLIKSKNWNKNGCFSLYCMLTCSRLSNPIRDYMFLLFISENVLTPKTAR